MVYKCPTAVFILVDHSREVACNLPTRFHQFKKRYKLFAIIVGSSKQVMILLVYLITTLGKFLTQL